MAQDQFYSMARAKAAVKFAEARVALLAALEAYSTIVALNSDDPPREITDQVIRLDRALVSLALVP